MANFWPVGQTVSAWRQLESRLIIVNCSKLQKIIRPEQVLPRQSITICTTIDSEDLHWRFQRITRSGEDSSQVVNHNQLHGYHQLPSLLLAAVRLSRHNNRIFWTDLESWLGMQSYREQQISTNSIHSRWPLVISECKAIESDGYVNFWKFLNEPFQLNRK